MAIIERAACVGGGVVGGGWVARLLHNGVDVDVYDPAPKAANQLDRVLVNADRVYRDLVGNGHERKGTLRRHDSLAAAVAQAELIQESVPERLELKQSVLTEIDQHAPHDALIASSTSGLLPSDLQERMSSPERFVVQHPFVPVYLLPLVEIVPGKQTAPETIERSQSLCAGIGMKPLVVRKEIAAFVADRLMEALWREALWLVKDDVATVGEIDDAIRFGCGLRWAQMGTFQTYAIAGGEGGMHDFLKQFGPALEWPWTKLMDTPEMDDALIEKIAAQTESQSAGRGVDELEQIRDDNLVAILKALGGQSWGAGSVWSKYATELRESDGSTS